MEPSPEDVILEEEIDPNYEPTEEELVEYATWLGMDLINHKNLLWIAKEALVAPLPNDWKPCLTEDDEIYYFNFTTGRSIWDHPCDEYYRKVYKEEVEKLNQLQQDNRAFVNSSPVQRDQRSSQRVVESISNPLQMDRGGDSQSSLNSSERPSSRDLMVDSKSSFMSCFPRDSPSTSQSNHLTRSLPPPHFVGHPALLNLKGGSFDSMIRLYAASLPQHGGGIPFADFFRMQGRLQLQRADNSASTCSGHTHMSQEKRLCVQGDDKREFEKKISQIKDRIEKKLVDEERVVLQQERVEMLERVCKQVQEEESHILDSLRREIMERMERNIREEAQALLAKRRKEIVEEVEHEMRAEKLVIKESHENQEANQKKRLLQHNTKAKVSTEDLKPQQLETSLIEAKRPNTNKELSEKQFTLNKTDGPGPTSIEQMEREEATHVKTQSENESLSKDSCPDMLRDGAQNMQRPTTKDKQSFVDHDEEDVIVRDSSQNLETECREEKRFEKSFHVQDLRTSLLLKLEVLMKIGTSSD